MIDKTEYCEKRISSGSIHTEYDNVTRFLLCEQMISLLERTNRQPVSHGHHKFEIDTNLDASQEIAKNFITGPIRVLAPAGSGKTKTLVNRIINLINNGIPEENILALAFNKKASDEMNCRLKAKQVTNVDVRTFHSLGYEIIRNKTGGRFNLQAEQSVNSIDPLILVLQQTKNDILPISDTTVEINGQTVPLKPVFNAYIERQWMLNSFNFDDLIYFPIRILIDDDIIRNKYQQRYQYLLVDEFQDLNKAQLLLLQILSLPENNVFIVGDDDQMIYGWRGAEVRHIIDFPKRYPMSQDCTLSTNYRSSQKIVRHSKWLIDYNTNRINKNIKARTNATPGFFDIELFNSLWEQAVAIADWISKTKTVHNFQWKDFAVLFRFHSYQFIIAMALDAKHIPHSLVHTERMFNSRIGRDIYAYLSVIMYPQEATAKDYAIILRTPNKYFSNNIISSITNWEELSRASEKQGLRAWERDKLCDFFNHIETLSHFAKQPTTTPHSLLTLLDKEIGLSIFYRTHPRFSAEVDESTDDVIVESIILSAKNFNDTAEYFQYFRQTINHPPDASSTDELDRQNVVVLTTIHKTKGNEYLNAAYFNLSMDSHTNSEVCIEEERRVTYVGVTRAIENIYITGLKNKLSKFIPELAFNPALTKISTKKLQDKIRNAKKKLLIKQIELMETEVLFRNKIFNSKNTHNF
ncbi:MAG: ATP-dependent helicase [Elusimicrobiota bacterium]